MKSLWLALCIALAFAPPSQARFEWLDDGRLAQICLDSSIAELDSALVALGDAQGFLLDLRAWPGAADTLLGRLLTAADDRLYTADRSSPLARPWVILIDVEQTTLEDDLASHRLIRVYDIPRDPTVVCGMPPDPDFRRAHKALRRLVKAEQKRAHDHLQEQIRK